MNEFNVVKVNINQIDLVKLFINNLGESAATFRYFAKRQPEIIQNHLVTLLVLKKTFPVGYGHLEPENENLWLGICLLPDYIGKGIGKLILDALIFEALQQKFEKIDLTVDKDNVNAITLYEKYNFKCVSDNGIYLRYRLFL